MEKEINLMIATNKERLEFRDYLKQNGFFNRDKGEYYYNLFEQDRIGLSEYLDLSFKLSMWEYKCLIAKSLANY